MDGKKCKLFIIYLKSSARNGGLKAQFVLLTVNNFDCIFIVFYRKSFPVNTNIMAIGKCAFHFNMALLHIFVSDVAI